MVTVGQALKRGYRGMQIGRTINIAKHYLAASVSLLSNQDNVTRAMKVPCWAGDLQPPKTLAKLQQLGRTETCPWGASWHSRRGGNHYPIPSHPIP